LSRGIAELDLHLLRREGIGDDPSAAYESLEDIEERPPTPDEERRLRELAADLQPANPVLDLTEASQGSVSNSATKPNDRWSSTSGASTTSR
jgi:hypothetical protein